MDDNAAKLAALAILSVTMIITAFIMTVGLGAEKAVLSGITGILGMVSGGSAGYLLGKSVR